MTKREIIEETAKFYTSKNRSYDAETQNCYYIADDGKRCAVGRCIKDDKVELAQTRLGDDAVVVDNFIQIKQLFKPEYKGHDVTFWASLQHFHDQSCNWNENGMTDQGKVEYNRLLAKYAEETE